MFDYPTLEGIDNIARLKLRKEATEYWRMLKHLHELWTSFGENAERLISIYDWHSKQRKMVEELSRVLDWHDIKTTNIATEMDRVDKYLKDIAIALGEAPLDSAIAEIDTPDDGIPF